MLGIHLREKRKFAQLNVLGVTVPRRMLGRVAPIGWRKVRHGLPGCISSMDFNSIAGTEGSRKIANGSSIWQLSAGSG